MVYQKLFDLIEDHQKELTNYLIEKIHETDELTHYHILPKDELFERIHQVIYNVYARLAAWLDESKSKNVIFANYRELGRVRFQEGIPLHESVLMLMIIKRHLFKYLRENRLYDSSYEINQLIEMSYYINLFFDRITYSVISGYEEEMLENMNAE